METRLFYYNGNYVILQGGSLVPMTTAETERYCTITRNVILVAFVPPSEARSLPELWSHSDMIVELVRLDETFASTIATLRFQDRLFPDNSYALVKTWLLSLNPTLIAFTAQTQPS